MEGVEDAAVAAFIQRWSRSEGAERAAYAQFLNEFCDLIGVERPEPPTSDAEAVRYRFEYPVKFPGEDGAATTGRIDLYRKGKFVLEAKQSREKGGRKEILAAQGSLFSDDPTRHAPRGRRGADRAWDVMMLHARRQAEDYAKRLPASHGWPPFLIICDVGHCFEFFADFTGQGKNYVQFPDRQNFRVYLDDLRKAPVRERIRAIWTEPETLDPARRAARVTRGIARRLAAVSKVLEKRHDPEDVALFLMRCLFTMFAEDTTLIPKDSFKTLLRDCLETPASFLPLVSELWRAMDRGDYSAAIRAQLPRFNGKLFADSRVYPLGREEIGELLAAAEHDWREVEPAIFGTLLEQALDPTERARLGAHYTPRAYVERLVVETVIEPLREDWRTVLASAQQARDARDAKAALARVEAFHRKLCATRVLDPACGTGNFLHVAQELMKRLEGEVLDAASELGASEQLGGFSDHSVGPAQFIGMELNERAVAIADLVLWIGHLQWHFRTRGYAPREPILKRLDHIHRRDAVLAWDGAPAPSFEGGRENYPSPRRPEWPEAEFIVGNPPFIGGKDLRGRIGDAKVEALRAAHPQMNESADFVMYWWDRCAELLTRKGTVLRRFGLVTTNSITQLFQRRVVERHLGARKPVSIVMAIADHPWTKAGKDAAAVRIAMTVVEAGQHEGRLREVVAESGLDTDEPVVELRETVGRIGSALTVGVDVTRTAGLRANEGLSSRGMMLFGSGFLVTRSQEALLGAAVRPAVPNVLKPYRNGRDLTSRSRDLLAIDLYGWSAEAVRDQLPEIYQHLLRSVKPERNRNRDADIKRRWWLFGRTRDEIRPALAGLQRYIVTVETAKHRVFQFLDASILPDNKLLAIALSDAFHLGVLSSKTHEAWYLASAGKLGVYERDAVYVKSRCFDPFPFPQASDAQKEAIRRPAEALDRLRKQVLAEHPKLTLTGLYNVREALLAGRELTPAEERIRDDGLVLILDEHHRAIDAAVADAYGWPVDLAHDEVLVRLVALNAQRTREEAAGQVRWLRPDYQRPRFAREGRGGEQIEAAGLVEPLAIPEARPRFPTDPVERVAAVLGVLAGTRAALDAGDIAQRFGQGRKVERAVREVLVSLARVGEISAYEAGRRFARRRAAGAT